MKTLNGSFLACNIPFHNRLLTPPPTTCSCEMFLSEVFGSKYTPCLTDSSCPTGYVMEHGIIYGSNWSDDLIVIDAEECSNQCSINPACCAFEYMSNSKEKTCELHKECVPTISFPKTNSIFCRKSNCKNCF